MKCRDQFEPESIQKCRGQCINSDLNLAIFNASASVSNDSDLTAAKPHLIEPEINNEILNLLVPSKAVANPLTDGDRRPDFYVEDKIQPEDLKVMEMEIVTNEPIASTSQPLLTDLDTNDIELSDEAYQGGHSYKKMSIHIGEDAALFLAKIQVQSDQPDESQSPIDVTKIKPTFQWKIGLWTKVKTQFSNIN